MGDYALKVPDEAVNRVLELVHDSEDHGTSAYPGKTFEEGVGAGIEYLLGFDPQAPLT